MAQIKRNSFILLLPLVAILQTSSLFADTSSETILLQKNAFEHISFRKIKPNVHTFFNQQLQIDVNNSASFLMQAFDHIKPVNRVYFEWRSEGLPQTKNAKHEEQREGDDAVFKLGLLLKSEDSLPNPFIPSWMKHVESLLKFPSENMIYLVANAKHETGKKWVNPYNKRVNMISIDGITDKQGWQHTSYQFETPVDVVAIWLMSDGDNTDSRFTVHIKNIRIE